MRILLAVLMLWAVPAKAVPVLYWSNSKPIEMYGDIEKPSDIGIGDFYDSQVMDLVMNDTNHIRLVSMPPLPGGEVDCKPTHEYACLTLEVVKKNVILADEHKSFTVKAKLQDIVFKTVYYPHTLDLNKVAVDMTIMPAYRALQRLFQQTLAHELKHKQDQDRMLMLGAMFASRTSSNGLADQISDLQAQVKSLQEQVEFNPNE